MGAYNQNGILYPEENGVVKMTMEYYGPDKIDPYEVDDFTRAYMECALWSSNDESNEDGGEPMDRNYSIEDIAHTSLSEMLADCNQFKEVNEDLIEKAIDTMALRYPSDCLSRMGHCFWLNRNGHGSGFWDEGTIDEKYRELLSKAAKAFGEVNLYIGDDGRVYHA